MAKAVILLSGGMDSATCLAIARGEGFDVFALSFDYGQRSRTELMAAGAIADAIGVTEHRVLELDIGGFGGSALTSDAEVPRRRSEAEIAAEIPITYVPARNAIFLSFALAFAEVRDAADIFIGVNAVDYSGYPDCRPEFIAAFETLANLATKAGVEGSQRCRIHTPLIHMTKAEIILKG